MKRTAAALISLVAAIALASCGGGPNHQEVADEQLDTLAELIETIASVKDEASADSAIKEFDRIAAKMEELKAQAEKLGDPSAEVKAEIRKKMESRKRELTVKINAVSETMKDQPELINKLVSAMARIGKNME